MNPYKFFRIGDIEVMHNDFVRYSNYKSSVQAVQDVGDGWRIPTIDELLYFSDLRKLGVGNFLKDFYWSSSLVGSAGCFCIRMSDGYMGVGSTTESLAIINTRLVRSSTIKNG